MVIFPFNTSRLQKSRLVLARAGRRKVIDLPPVGAYICLMIPRIAFPILLALALCVPAFAGNSKPWVTPGVHHTVIESVSADSITITQADGSHTYKITKDTEITFKGETTTVDQLQAGMRVIVTPDAADEDTAGEIAANDPPKDPTPRPKN